MGGVSAGAPDWAGPVPQRGGARCPIPPMRSLGDGRRLLRAQVQEKFETGGLLLDTRGYKIDAGRRDAPGEVEYHERVVDVMREIGRAHV